jgi:hypothetical protein
MAHFVELTANPLNQRARIVRERRPLEKRALLL